MSKTTEPPEDEKANTPRTRKPRSATDVESLTCGSEETETLLGISSSALYRGRMDGTIPWDFPDGPSIRGVRFVRRVIKAMAEKKMSPEEIQAEVEASAKRRADKIKKAAEFASVKQRAAKVRPSTNGTPDDRLSSPPRPGKKPSG